ncbi:hypothetical protein D3C71_852090 [compost metagenome]
MHRDLARTLHGDVAALDRDVRPARRRQADAFRRRPVDVRGGADDIDFLARLHVEHVGLRLELDGLFGGDQLQAGIVLARLDDAGQRADGLAAVHAQLATADELGVLAAHQGGGFAILQLDVLARQHAQAGAGGDGDDGVAAVR